MQKPVLDKGCDNRNRLAAVFIMIILIGLLSLSGCKGGILGIGKDRKTSGPVSVDTDFHKGTDGLVIEFVENMPPSEAWEGEEFPVGIELRNKGAYNIPHLRLILTNAQMDYINIKEANWHNIDNFEGKSLRNAEGAYEVKTFEVGNIGLPEDREAWNFLFKASACYQYETLGSVDICISPGKEGYMETRDEACQVEDKTVSSGQGAPIAVTKVEERIIKVPGSYDTYELQLIITYENKGLGLLTSLDNYLKKCNNEAVSYAELADVAYTVWLSGETLTECREPKLDIGDINKATIFCKTIIDTRAGSYTTPLIINLSYGYVTNDVEKTIKVKSSESSFKEACDDEYCSDHGCIIYGSTNPYKQCTDTDKDCCNRPLTMSNCVEHYKDTHECINEEPDTCPEGNDILNACPPGKICCRKVTTTAK